MPDIQADSVRLAASAKSAVASDVGRSRPQGASFHLSKTRFLRRMLKMMLGGVILWRKSRGWQWPTHGAMRVKVVTAVKLLGEAWRDVREMAGIASF